MALPNFFIVGAPKAGTTSLYAYLGQHAQIYLSPLKEPCYFAAELRPENFAPEERPRLAREMRTLEEYLHGDMRVPRFGGLVTQWDDYLRLFGNATDQLAIGEASACYLWSQSAARNIAARIPQARIIINLRNPVDRAFSQYLQMVTVGAIRRSFREQIQASLRCRSEQFGRSWPFLEFGCYYPQIVRYLDHFPRSQVHISLYEDLELHPQELLSQLFRFLGVDPAFVADVTHRHHEPRVPRLTAVAYALKKLGIWSRLHYLAPASVRRAARPLIFNARSSLVMAAEDRAFLTDYYRDDVLRLEALLQRDLSAWTDIRQGPRVV